MLRKVSTFLIAMLLSVPWANGQSTFGGIVGVVKDPSQGAVAGTQLTLISLDDHSQRNASTDGNGGFEFINLRAGRYELVLHADGFADYKVSSLQLDARQSLRLDVSLKLATSSQSIEVSSDAGPVINTENGTIGDSKDFQQITGLPVNYRGATTSPLAMLATVPGAQQDANGNVSVGGGLPSQVQYSVDGSSTVNIRQHGALGNMNPSFELTSEFKVTQFNNNAEFSQVGDVTISTKSGSEQFHGSGFEYLQNDAVDAEVWNSGDKPHKAYNTFGGSLGGPLSLKKLTHGKTKTFFFADFEANPRRFSTPLFLFVSTNAMRQGDFSALSTLRAARILVDDWCASLMKAAMRNPVVFDDRFSRCRRLLYFIARRVLGGSEGAEEAVKNCLLTVTRNLPKFESEGAFRSWLLRILIDEALLILRQKNRTSATCHEQVFAEER
jgi:hypothetical protein